MIPLKDENPTNNKSYIRLIILIICSLIFLFQSFGGINNFLIGYFYTYKLRIFYKRTLHLKNNFYSKINF